VPFEVNTFPDVPGATNSGVDVPFPRTTLLAVKVVRPVPPWATDTVAACLINLPVVPLNATKELSVADAGPETSPVPLPLALIV
jgi:hypothetical protein